jgi:hypothetical protein
VFWGTAIADREFSSEQRLQFRKARRRFERILRAGAARAPRTAAQKLRVRDDARRLLTTLIGIVVQATFDPADWPAWRQRAYVAEALRLPAE